MDRLHALIERFYRCGVYSRECPPWPPELADALWLASHLAPGSDPTPKPDREAPPPAERFSGDGDGDDDTPADGDQPKDTPHAPPGLSRRQGSETAEAELRVREGPRAGPPGPGATTLRVARPSLLPDPLRIGRALRPLLQRLPSRSRRVLDEPATVHNFAELRLPVPVLRGAPERRWELAVVIDHHPATVLWQPLLAELTELLARHGAFRDLRVWRLDTAGSGPVRLWPGVGSSGVPRSPKVLLDPLGRRVVLIVSDFTAAGWRAGRSPDPKQQPQPLDVLADWQSSQPVVLLPLMPAERWPRTAFGAADLVAVTAGPPVAGAGAAGLRLLAGARLLAAGANEPRRLPLPVVGTDPDTLSAWARGLAGRTGAELIGVRFPTGPAPALRPGPPPPEPDPREHLRRFRASASAPARALVLACAGVPLTLPVVRLVQEAAGIDPNPTYLAELFLTGLLRPIREQPCADPSPLERIYDFPPDVRQLLIEDSDPADLRDLLRRIGRLIEQRQGSTRDFLARWLDPDRPVDTSGAEPLFEPFAQIRLQVLRRLGGHYLEGEGARLAASLERAGSPPRPDLRGLDAVPTHLTGEPQELQAPIVARKPPGPAHGVLNDLPSETPDNSECELPNADEDHGADPVTTQRTEVSESVAQAIGELEPTRFDITDLCAMLETYLPQEQVREVYRAYLFGAEAHQGQSRKSGEPYIFHPLAVARILADMRMDYRCLMAAILHDVIEDTPTAKEHLAREFGDEIAELVDGVSKLTQMDFKPRIEAPAANLRKMMLAMTHDIRVILIKLADRLHNMRTLDAMIPEKRRRISRETLDIYVPIANRLGLNTLRLELEDLGFRHHWPWRDAVLAQAVGKMRQAQREIVATVELALRQCLQQEGIDGEVYGREKHLYSIYCKMQQKSRAFHDLVDVFAFRVIVDRVDTCYRVLGQMHGIYKPVPGRFKDYIAIPKSNGYQGLHTVLAGPQGVPLEIQIHTADMERVAAAGIFAHWQDETGLVGNSGNPVLARDWLNNLRDLQRKASDSQEFLAQVQAQLGLFPDEVYVFTPKGAVIALPKGATVVDFAYAIHSDVGNTCVAARIDRHLVPLRTQLRSGRSVEILTAPGAKPNAGWLNFVVTGKARANIRRYLKNLQHQEAEALGRRMLNAALAGFGLDTEQVGPACLAAYASEVGYDSSKRLFAEIGLGNRMPVLVARRLAEPSSSLAPETPVPRLVIRGTEGMVVNFARCCRPIPGDPITGLFSPGKGIVVHASDCRNLGEFQTRRDTALDVEWAAEIKAEFGTEIRVEVGNRRGALATIAAAIAEQGSNIENVQSRDKGDMTSTLDFLINVRNRDHLAAVMRRLRQIPTVMRISRMSNAQRLARSARTDQTPGGNSEGESG